MEYETSLRNDLAKSQAIRKCIKIAWDLHYKVLFEKYEADMSINDVALLNEKPKGKDPVGAKMQMLSENLGSGPLTRMKKTSRRAG